MSDSMDNQRFKEVAEQLQGDDRYPGQSTDSPYISQGHVPTSFRVILPQWRQAEFHERMEQRNKEGLSNLRNRISASRR